MTTVPDAPDASAHNPGSELRPELRSELRNWCEAWKTCLQNVLAQVSGQPIAFEISSQPLATTGSDLWYTVVAGGATHGEMTLRLAAASGTRLAKKFLGETEPATAGVTAVPTTAEGIPPENIIPEDITPVDKEALEELLRQIAGLAATALASIAGGEVQLHLSPSAAPSWSSDAIVCLHTRDEAGTSIAIEIQISPALAAALQPRVESASTVPKSAQGKTESSLLSSTPPTPSSSYRRLLDVGLNVKLRFGTRRMLLRDVLALSAGVVVELDNALHSPVDLLLDGRLIAQGEVVIVDGKYGLRITDAVDPQPAHGSPG
jgi:flagellar motor switch protein FliN/FliY